MNTLIESTQELLRFAIAERDAFYDCSTDAEGNLTDPGDQAELDRMDHMIDRAQVALSDALQGGESEKDAERYRHIRHCGTLSDEITHQMFDDWIDRLIARGQCSGDGRLPQSDSGDDSEEETHG